MKFIGNVIWVIFGGLAIALEYFVASFVLIITIIGIPFGIQTFKIGLLALWPFGSEVREKPHTGGCLYTLMNILWLLFGGIWIAISHFLFGLLFFITIIGIPFARQHFKLAGLALSPFGKDINY
ncbi:MAG: YccF domain-containing protein [Bacteroidales bacterium]|nr:YccF domain-containing protein [Bacteroidales bacterium]